MSGNSRDAHGLQQEVVANHREFAAVHGYTYWWERGSKVSQYGLQPYWTKIAMLRERMAVSPDEEFFVWVDDDIVLTNHRVQDMFAHALHAHPSSSIIVTQDASKWHSVNTGVMIVRNDARARGLLAELWRRATAVRADGVSLGFDSQRHCLHEQQALQEMLAERVPGIAAVRQRQESADQGPADPRLEPHSRPSFNLNTFLRWSHYDDERGLAQRFTDDGLWTKWRPGDFAGHCSGMSRVRRGICVHALLNAVQK